MHKSDYDSVVVLRHGNLFPSSGGGVRGASSWWQEVQLYVDDALPTGVNIVYSNCGGGHGRYQLCCKSGFEFQNYYIERLTKKQKYK
jgi:hypothetical protein